jgi:hypothetical protein
VGSVFANCKSICIARVVFSYDIACKYNINFLKRVSEGAVKLLNPEQIPGELVWLVPKFHLAGHRPECADQYSFNFTLFVGRMSGELVETPWAETNWLQYSTREMTWGARRDIITAVLLFWNWWKIITMGRSESHLLRNTVSDQHFFMGHTVT